MEIYHFNFGVFKPVIRKARIGKNEFPIFVTSTRTHSAKQNFIDLKITTSLKQPNLWHKMWNCIIFGHLAWNIEGKRFMVQTSGYDLFDNVSTCPIIWFLFDTCSLLPILDSNLSFHNAILWANEHTKNFITSIQSLLRQSGIFLPMSRRMVKNLRKYVQMSFKLNRFRPDKRLMLKLWPIRHQVDALEWVNHHDGQTKKWYTAEPVDRGGSAAFELEVGSVVSLAYERRFESHSRTYK